MGRWSVVSGWAVLWAVGGEWRRGRGRQPV